MVPSACICSGIVVIWAYGCGCCIRDIACTCAYVDRTVACCSCSCSCAAFSGAVVTWLAEAVVVVVVLSGVVGSVAVAALIVTTMGCWIAKGDKTAEADT